MNLEKAKEILRKFTGGNILTFNVTRFEDDSWVAKCDQIPAIMTCGDNSDPQEMENLMKDAILTAAGIEIDDKYIDELLYDASVKKDIAIVA